MIYRAIHRVLASHFLFLFFFHQSSLYPIKILVKNVFIYYCNVQGGQHPAISTLSTVGLMTVRRSAEFKIRAVALHAQISGGERQG